MIDRERLKERRDQVARYRVMGAEATDPLAAGLIHDIVRELEADLAMLAEVEAQRAMTGECALEPAIVRFHGGTLACLVHSLREDGATLVGICPRNVPDHFTLALPRTGTSHRCRLAWRRDTQIGVAFE